MSILPRAVAASANFPTLTTAQMIGTGALKLRQRNGNTITLEPNADYYAGAPGISTWTLQVFADQAALNTAYSAKQIDVLPAVAEQYGAFKDLAGCEHTCPPMRRKLSSCCLILTTTTFNDARVRQALTFALDRNVLLGDIGRPGTVD